MTKCSPGSHLATDRGSLLVFADDWGRHPSSCQHLISHLLPTHPVAWVNTIGMRRPALDRLTLRRGVEKIGPWLRRTRPADALAENLRVLDPKMWPWFSRRHDRWINRQMLLRSLRPVVQSLPTPITAITTLPIVADLVGKLRVDRWVYYCVDDFSQWPGLDLAALARLERKLVAKVDRLIAASETLQAHLAELGRPSSLLTHGVDLAHWQPPAPAEPLESLAQFERPLVVFWGLIDPRMDVELIRRLAADLTQGTIVLVGPTDHPHPALLTAPRVRHVPPVPYAELPAIAAAASVLVMPYNDSPVTRAIQPLKLKEYLATGKPVIARRLPAVEAWADCIDAVSTPEEFSAAVRRRIVTGIDESQASARHRLARESWDAKAREFSELALS